MTPDLFAGLTTNQVCVLRRYAAGKRAKWTGKAPVMSEELTAWEAQIIANTLSEITAGRATWEGVACHLCTS